MIDLIHKLRNPSRDLGPESLCKEAANKIEAQEEAIKALLSRNIELKNILAIKNIEIAQLKAAGGQT